MDLTGLIETQGVMASTVIGTLKRMAEREVLGALVDLAVYEAAQELISRAEAALQEAQGQVEALEGQRADLDDRIDAAEDAHIDAQAAWQKASLIEAQSRGTARAVTARGQRVETYEAQRVTGTTLNGLCRERRELVEVTLPAAEGEIGRLEALLLRFREIERPDVSCLRGVLASVRE